MLGIQDAEHEESAPGAQRLVIHRLACSLVGATETVALQPGTLFRRVYGQDQAAEPFACSYGLNPLYRERISQGDLRVAAVGPEGEVRAVELSSHRFFLATLYLPQVNSRPGQPHPLILAYLKAAQTT